MWASSPATKRVCSCTDIVVDRKKQAMGALAATAEVFVCSADKKTGRRDGARKEGDPRKQKPLVLLVVMRVDGVSGIHLWEQRLGMMRSFEKMGILLAIQVPRAGEGKVDNCDQA
jgi:hypothetical protein